MMDRIKSAFFLFFVFFLSSDFLVAANSQHDTEKGKGDFPKRPPSNAAEQKETHQDRKQASVDVIDKTAALLHIFSHNVRPVVKDPDMSHVAKLKLAAVCCQIPLQLLLQKCLPFNCCWKNVLDTHESTFTPYRTLSS